MLSSASSAIKSAIRQMTPASFWPDDDEEGSLEAAVQSKILKPEHAVGLIQVCGGKPPHLRELLYSGSRDGFTGADFHRMCDNKGPTFIVIRSAAPLDNVFGG